MSQRLKTTKRGNLFEISYTEAKIFDALRGTRDEAIEYLTQYKW
jgi:hypothetical protein